MKKFLIWFCYEVFQSVSALVVLFLFFCALRALILTGWLPAQFLAAVLFAALILAYPAGAVLAILKRRNTKKPRGEAD